MDSGEFLTGPEATRAIARAAKVARTAVSIHAYDAGHESDKIAGCGACAEACAFVHTLPWGPQACRRSREKHARTALKRNRPVPYLCHMGFACVAAPVLPGSDDLHVATFGPYCPAETPKALERDAMEGLTHLEQMERKELPFSLEDIPLVPAEVVPEVAEWLAETFLKHSSSKQIMFEQSTLPGSNSSPYLNNNETVNLYFSGTYSRPSDAVPISSIRRSRAKPVRDAFGARAILAAMGNPDATAFREVLANQLVAGPKRQTAEQVRARVSAVVSAVTEAAQGQGRSLIGSPLEVLAAGLASVKTGKEAVGLAVRALAPLRRALLRAEEGSAAFYAGIERYIEEHLGDSLSLGAAAKHFDLPSSTLTRRLERRYGLTFTGYVARRRVERAKTLLAKSKLSVDTVARRVGLTDGAHLRKLMQRFEGITPSELRPPRSRSSG